MNNHPSPPPDLALPRRRLVVSALGVVAVLALGSLSACSLFGAESSTNAECGNGKTLTISLPEEPTSLDGNYDTLVVPAQVSANLYDGLFTLNEDLDPVPNLAADYTQPDATTYKMTLRDDVTFHDGSKFTSADVINSFDRITKDKKLASKQTTYVSNIASIKADGEHAVTFKLIEPDASFVKTLASLLYITPKAATDELGNAKFATNPVGSGPFKFSEWVKGDHLTMDANCDYWRGEPKVSRVVWRFISQPATALAGLESGQIDMVPYVSPDLVESLKSNPDFEVTTVPGVRSFFVQMNSFEGPTKDPRVRQALNYAIDKEAIVTDLLKGAGLPSGQLATPAVFGYNPAVTPYPYDPEKAKQLLSEAGFANGLTLTIYNDKAVNNLPWQAVGEQLKKVGINVRLKTDANYFPNTFLEKKMGANEMYMAGCSSLALDADFCMGLTFDSKRRGLYFNSPETDQLITQARGEQSEVARQKIYDELMVELHEAAPVLFLYSSVDTYARSSQVSFTPRSDQKLWLWNAKKS
ncbi:MAG: ABC transporter substrate-binding protein [Nocardioides sp.]|uniref:ABC transporter substrate-binding protein n=1 Tax=Nocardioides sp. TaxID=35761 RepID=UPI003D6AE1EF